jgi:hypothetical protein
MRRAARTDGNQAEIVAALRAAGASVHPCHAAGQGFPDLTVGYRGVNWLIEVKDPSKPKADQKLTPAQEGWHRDWRGQVAVVRTPEEALAVIGVTWKDE